MLTKVKTRSEIKQIKTSGKILATVLNKIAAEVKPGMNGIDINELVEKETKALGGKPAFKGYMGFPAAICISINDAIVHGIPTKQIFQKGDIIGFDYGIDFEGMITDSAITLAVDGTGDLDTQQLIAGTHEALMAGINAIKGKTPVGDISYAVETVLKGYGFGIIRTLVGHGVGHQIHEEPNIPNYGKKGEGMLLLPGMTIAIEPMTTLGGDAVEVDKDGWTYKSVDGTLTAHFEHTVLITEDGSEILTRI